LSLRCLRIIPFAPPASGAVAKLHYVDTQAGNFLSVKKENQMKAAFLAFDKARF